MVVAFLAQPAGRSHSIYSHLPLSRSHSPPLRCPSSPTFRTPRGRLRTAQLMNSIAGTGTSPFRQPGGNTLYIHTFHSLRSHSPSRRCPSSPRSRFLRGFRRAIALSMLNTTLLELFPQHPSDSPPPSLRNPHVALCAITLSISLSLSTFPFKKH